VPVISTTVIDVDLPSSWAIGNLFGGAIGALLATRAVAAADRPELVPVTTSLRFVRPAVPGAARVRTTVLTAGRSYGVVQCELETDAATLAVATITLAPGDSLTLDPAGPGLGLPAPTDLAEAESAAGPLASVARQVDWRAITPWADGERSTDNFSAWIRFRDDSFITGDGVVHPNWYLVASDLLGPALARSGVDLPFRIATVALDVTAVARTTSPWLLQCIRVRGIDADAVATLDLLTPSGAVVATATQRAVVLPATVDELPYSVTAFGRGSPATIPVPLHK
jgi:hypothetical protein